MKAGDPQTLQNNPPFCMLPWKSFLSLQGYGEASMLKGMVQGAVGWMKAGLPLRVLKLVLYCKVQDGKLQKHSLRCFDTVIATFNELKERYEMQLLLPKVTE